MFPPKQKHPRLRVLSFSGNFSPARINFGDSRNRTGAHPLLRFPNIPIYPLVAGIAHPAHTTLRKGIAHLSLSCILQAHTWCVLCRCRPIAPALGALSLRCLGCIPPRPRLPLCKSTRFSDSLILGGILRADSSSQTFIYRCWHAVSSVPQLDMICPAALMQV